MREKTKKEHKSTRARALRCTTTDLEVQIVEGREHNLLVLFGPPDQREHCMLPRLRRSEFVLGGGVQDIERELDIALEARFQKPNRTLHDVLHRVGVAAEKKNGGEGGRRGWRGRRGRSECECVCVREI